MYIFKELWRDVKAFRIFAIAVASIYLIWILAIFYGLAVGQLTFLQALNEMGDLVIKTAIYGGLGYMLGRLL